MNRPEYDDDDIELDADALFDGGLSMDPEVALPSSHPDAPITGKRVRLDVEGIAPNIIAKSTQLISARVREPRQWLITLMQPVTEKSGVNPWISTFDGGAVYPPVAPDIFTAPEMPSPVGQPSLLQVALRWGAGGTAWETAFDYPAVGGVFGITADAVDLNVRMKPGAQAPYASLNLVPVVGAFMVPGQMADPVPCRWLEPTADIAHGTSRFWAVKPYARRVHLSSVQMQTAMLVSWLDTAGFIITAERVNIPAGAPGVNTTIDVPSAATVLGVANLDPAVFATVTAEWEIGLT